METTMFTTMDEVSNKTYSMKLCKLPNVTFLIVLNEREKLTSSFLLFVIIFIGSLANPIMVVCICRIWSSNNSTCRHLLHLAIGDMIRVFFCLPIRIAGYFELVAFGTKNLLLFQIRIFLDMFTEILQLFILLLISRDRYYAVAKPFNKSSDQKLKSFFKLICSWSLAIFGASCASYFYEDYIKCDVTTHFYVFMLLFLVFESSTVVGILQFYLRTIYFLCKQRKKMLTLRQKKVCPCTTPSEVKEKSETTPKKILPGSIMKKEMTNNVVHTKVVDDDAVTDLKYPETKTSQNERQTEIKVNSDLSKGVSDSANIPPTSLVLVPLNLSADVNENTTNWKPQKGKSETIVTDLKCREKEYPQMDTDATKVLENSQEGDRTQTLNVVINCTLNAIATKTEIVDGQNTSIINPKEEQSYFRRAHEIGKTQVKPAVNFVAGVVNESAENETPWEISKFSSGNDRDPTQGTIGPEKLFVISQHVEFTVKSVTTLSDINRPSSFSNFKDKTESGLQLEKEFVNPTDDNKEVIKSNSLSNIENKAPAQTKVYEENESKKVKSTGKKEKRNSVKFCKNNLSSTANRVASSKCEVGQMSEVTATNIVGPFCPLPKRSKLKQRYHKEVRVTQRITIFIIILLISWLPLYVTRFLQIIFLLRGRCCFYQQYRVLWWESLSASSSAFNPCLYGVLNAQLRNEFRRLMRRFRDLLMNHCCCK